MEKLKKILIPVDIVLGVIIVAFIALTVLVGIKGKASASVPTGYDVEGTEINDSGSTNNFDYTEIKLDGHTSTFVGSEPVEDTTDESTDENTDEDTTDDESDDAQ